MEASAVYKAIADPQRLRILNLLEAGPICVCHLQTLLEESQVKISKQLGYLRKLGLVEAERSGTWMIYRLSEGQGLLGANLNYLRSAECGECQRLRTDLAARQTLLARIEGRPDSCPVPVRRNIAEHASC